LLVLSGLLLFFVLEKLLNGLELRPRSASSAKAEGMSLVTVNLLADGLHNFMDGVMIGASYVVSNQLGMATTLAVLCHELPQELGDFGVLLHGGLGVRRALWLNWLSAWTAVVGTLAALVLGGPALEKTSQVLLPVTAGGLLYIAAADLMPALQGERRLRTTMVQIVLVLGGIALMATLALVE
jgi:zinc and cadmium transporter